MNILPSTALTNVYAIHMIVSTCCAIDACLGVGTRGHMLQVHWCRTGRGLPPRILKFDLFLLTFQPKKVVFFISSG